MYRTLENSLYCANSGLLNTNFLLALEFGKCKIRKAHSGKWASEKSALKMPSQCSYNANLNFASNMLDSNFGGVMKKEDEKLRQMSGYLDETIDPETGEKKNVYRPDSDKIHFRRYDNDGRLVTERKLIKGKQKDVPVDNNFFSENIDQNLLIQRICTTKTYSDLLIFQVLKTKFSIVTGLVHVKQAEIVKATGLNKSNVSQAMKRLKSPVITDGGRTLIEFVREYEGDFDRPAGLALNPELVIIGEHFRARDLWGKAEKQRLKKEQASAEQLTQAIIQRIQERVWEGEEEGAVLESELAEVKDDSIRRDVQFKFTAEWDA